MSVLKLLTITGLLLVSINCPVYGAYRIEGRVNLGKEWQPKVYLALIDELSDYYRASADLIVSTGYVEADGTFVIEGNELPDEPRFYRLYMMKEQNTEFDACLYVGGDDHNFIHLILDNQDTVEIWADSTYYSPFGNYAIEGTEENHLMRELSRMVYPSFYFYQIKFPTELRLSEQKLFESLRQFSDTCSNTLATLAAVINTDMETYAVEYADFYQSFGKRLEKEMPQSRYTQNYMRRLHFYVGEPDEQRGGLWGIVLGQSVLVLFLIGYIWRLRKTMKDLVKEKEEPAPDQDWPALLTSKEAEIFALISSGKSNKEIASELYIEVSTVKTHINKLYSKLGVNNRKEAARLYKEQL